jgi:hypothetical protein
MKFSAAPAPRTARSIESRIFDFFNTIGHRQRSETALDKSGLPVAPDIRGPFDLLPLGSKAKVARASANDCSYLEVRDRLAQHAPAEMTHGTKSLRSG